MGFNAPRNKNGSNGGRWTSINPICFEKCESMKDMYYRLKTQGFIEAKHYNCIFPSPKVNMEKYSSYCHDYGHDIEGCFDVTRVVQQLIHDGKIPIPKGWIPPILSFTIADLPRVINFSQPLCVALGCNYRRISGILVDNKSNFNIFSKESLCKLRQKSLPLGISNSFKWLKLLSTFLLFWEKPWLHVTQAIASAFHQKVKFSTPKGVMVIHGDIPTARMPPVYCNVVKSIENPTIQHNQLKSQNRGNAMSLWELISSSPTHRDDLIRKLKTATIDLFEESTNIKEFMSKDILCN
uniref:Uncharacterized protein n=1 Tax=Chenopodium quinoa TaxID=63459 RepID=A0A803N221_CHEQI